MTPSPQLVRATSHYRKIQNESRAAGADPVQLVTMLYDELELALGVIISMLRQGEAISLTAPAHRARSILIGLDASLDRDNGGTLASSLSDIYVGMRIRLDQAIQSRNVDQLVELKSGVETISHAWRQVRDKVRETA